MNIKECLDKGLLRKGPVEKPKIQGSLDLAEHFLERAQGIMTQKYYDIAFTTAYNSMFHSARALLFSKGYSERSHYCMIIALKAEFDNELAPFFDALDAYRMLRHSVQYSGAACGESEAKEAIGDAAGFLTAARKKLGK